MIAVAKTLFRKVQVDLGQGLVATGVQVVLPERPVTWDSGAVEAWARVLLNGAVWVQGMSIIRDEKKRVYRLAVPGRKVERNGKSSSFRPYVSFTPRQRLALLQAALELVKELKTKAEASRVQSEAAAAKDVVPF